MSIDRIGKGGGATGPLGTQTPAGPGGTSATSGTGQVFEVRKSERPEAANATGAVAEVRTEATPLERLKAGKIDVDTYVDLKVDEATAHLSGLGPAQLDEIRAMLKDKLTSDPGLAELVKGATGQLPSAAADE